jgi:hypothetical protein
MTRPRNSALKPWMVVVSVGATVGGWILLARQATDVSPQTAPEPSNATQSVTADLPPIPTVEALHAYAAPTTGPGSQLDLPQVPSVVSPSTLSQGQAPSAPSPRLPFTTRSSR